LLERHLSVAKINRLLCKSRRENCAALQMGSSPFWAPVWLVLPNLWGPKIGEVGEFGHSLAGWLAAGSSFLWPFSSSGMHFCVYH